MKIYKEVPSGAINWVNKVFTFLNNVSQIDDLWVDNVIYTSFVVSWNQVTLTDAPTLSIYADYLTAWSEVPVTTDITFWDIKSKVWALLWQKPTSINFSTDIVWDEINTQSLEVWRGRVVNILSPQQIIRAGDLWFQEWKFTTRIKAGWIATELVNVWDTEISTETANLNPTWFVLLWGDIIQYTGITSTQLTWVSGITTEHYVWDKIIQVYPVPANFETMMKMEKVITSSDWIYYSEIPLNTWRVSYQIMRVWSDVYLKIDWLSNNDEIRITYTKKYEDLVDDTDITPFPDKYWINVIAYLVAGNLAYDKGMPTSERLLNRAYGNLRTMYQYYTNETKVIKQKIMPKHYSFKVWVWWNITL